MKDLKFAGLGWLTGNAMLSGLGVAILLLSIISILPLNAKLLSYIAISRIILSLLWGGLVLYKLNGFLHLI